MTQRRKALFVASTGGHLEQLSRLEGAFHPTFDAVEYATFDDEQSRSLLEGRVVHHVPYIPPRGLRQALRVEPTALKVLARGFTDVVSTGAAVAMPFLVAARALRLRAHYIESAARSEGPSLTGRLVSRTLPGVRLYSQYPFWAEGRWQYRGSVFDRFSLAPEENSAPSAARVVVTLGTMRRYQFRRAIVALQRLLPDVVVPDADVLWQVGDTDVTGLGIEGKRLVPAHELRTAIRHADLVIAHAGIGSCLQILDAGRAPVLLPRRADLSEHVDDHQRMIAFELDRRSLGVARDPDVLCVDDLRACMARRVTAQPMPAPFRLQGYGRDAWEAPRSRSRTSPVDA